MTRSLKTLTMAFILSVIMIFAVAGAAFADNTEKGSMYQNQSGDCICNDGECVSNEYYHHHYWCGTKGPHVAQHGQVTE